MSVWEGERGSRVEEEARAACLVLAHQVLAPKSVQQQAAATEVASSD